MTQTKFNEEVVPFRASDGFQLNLIHIWGDKTPSKGTVLLVHGAGVSANIFRAPVDTDIVKYLVESGYDVWLENWRASIQFKPNKWTLDQAAVLDHPMAVKTVLERTGQKTLKAIVHCQGSTSFMISLVTGRVPQVTHVVSNAVSLHPVVPFRAKIKLVYLTPVVSLLAKYLNPQWAFVKTGLFSRLLSWYVKMTYSGKDSNACNLISYTYGADEPTLWVRDNLNAKTNEWLQSEFAQVPVRFFRQMRKSVQHGYLTRRENVGALPDNYAYLQPDTEARVTFIAGEQNRCFLPQSQLKTFEFFNRFKPDFHSYHCIKGYGHLDIFMGQNAAKDVFPTILEALDK